MVLEGANGVVNDYYQKRCERGILNFDTFNNIQSVVI